MDMTRKRATRPAREGREWMTLPNAARALDEHRQTVLNRASAGEVRSKRMDVYTFIWREDVERILAERTAAERAVG